MFPREGAVARRRCVATSARVALTLSSAALSALGLVLSGCTAELVGEACGGDGRFCGSSDGAQRAPPLSDQPCSGYTLLADLSRSGATLVDMAGNVVHQWVIGGFPPTMRPGGALTGCVVPASGGAECGQMQEVSWSGEPLWSFADWTGGGSDTTEARQHHDLQQEGDSVGYYAPGQVAVAGGRTLVLAYARRSKPELRDEPIEDDVIYELDGLGSLTNVVWYGADHVDDLGFDEKARAHLRTIAPGSVIDWLHGNAITVLGPNRWFDEGRAEFHPNNIMYSSRHANVVAILSRETGSVVWRVGPDFAGRPEERLGQFVGQHSPHLIPRGLPGAGNVLVVDNGGNSGYGSDSGSGRQDRYTRDYSRVVEFDPVTLEIVWQYGGALAAEHFYSYVMGSAQRLPNGNTLIAIGLEGRVVEVTPERRVVWEHWHRPWAVEASDRWLYRAYRVPPEWLPADVNAAHGRYATWASLFEGR